MKKGCSINLKDQVLAAVAPRFGIQSVDVPLFEKMA